jgi:2-C-methyl-D-erythritol 4-phosphate cytidylyltransferase
VLRALRPFLAHPEIGSVVLVVPAGVAQAPPEWLSPIIGDRLTLAVGGVERMDSVAAGLAALPAEMTIVLIHDGARPFPEPDVIDAVIQGARAGSGVIAALPVTDTIKEAEDGRVIRTVPREGLWRAQTPQGFPRPMLEYAFEQARANGFKATDDAALVEAAGGTVLIIPDVTSNLKITTAEDFLVADALLRRTP